MTVSYEWAYVSEQVSPSPINGVSGWVIRVWFNVRCTDTDYPGKVGVTASSKVLPDPNPEAEDYVAPEGFNREILIDKAKEAMTPAGVEVYEQQALDDLMVQVQPPIMRTRED